ncbi:hypothetical protein GCM10010145_62710 [Streptomyces ruber]|uniref:Class E sortase n=2 Tax=Streptomyces TaxID=1883 RepID=A0A918EY15_9ACTN|nr:class E sortase [Streptomyces ruber]GGQ84623.1 hypothetical protein GCM10010145_62710 [Streptomyces ruber]
MRVVVRTVSEMCVTLGVLTVLFVTYVLFWTGADAGSEMQHQIATLKKQWAEGAAHPYRDGAPFALMYIPRLGSTWNKPVLEGTGTDTLKQGLGHYGATARLGQQGNFAVAGHRRTYGDPFKDFPRLRPGDAVVLRDATTWFTYRIDKGPYKTVPADVGVIDPVPRESGYTRSGRYLTLTTCDPEWGHSHRLIVWAKLRSTQPVNAGEPEALRR